MVVLGTSDVRSPVLRTSVDRSGSNALPRLYALFNIFFRSHRFANRTEQWGGNSLSIGRRTLRAPCVPGAIKQAAQQLG